MGAGTSRASAGLGTRAGTNRTLAPLTGKLIWVQGMAGLQLPWEQEHREAEEQKKRTLNGLQRFSTTASIL